MSTQVHEPEPAVTPDAETSGIDMVITLEIGPGGLDRYLALVGDRRNPLIKYRDGSLTLVSPSHRHERRADRIDAVIKGICAVLGIGYSATASTLYRRPGFDHGVEGDKTYYVANEPAVRGVTDEIDLGVYPPPDLAVEVVATHEPKTALGIWQELGVPEVWVYRVKRQSLEFLHLDPQGRYAPGPSSRALPFLTPADVVPWVESVALEPENVWESRLRAWVRDALAPRRG